MIQIGTNRAVVFFVVFIILALCINGMKWAHDRQEQESVAATQAAANAQRLASEQAQQKAQLQEQRQLELDQQAANQKTAADAAAAHSNYLARYLNVGISRKPGVANIALVFAGASSRRMIEDALNHRLKTTSIELFSSFFKPAFVNDNLFASTFNGSTEAISKLELSHSLDGLLLARETARYSETPNLQNLITASVELEIVLIPIGGNAQNQTWSFSANGPGFRKNDALVAAEERIIKQMSNDTSMSLSQISPGN